MSTIYAWASPGTFSGSAVDEVFLTTYNSPFEGSPPPDCWPCFSTVRSSNEPNVRLVTKLANANLESARGICRPNVDPLKSDVSFRYGVDGLSVQLANQILRAANTSKEVARIAARDVRGGYLTSFLFGDYGRQDLTEGHSTPELQNEPVFAGLPVPVLEEEEEVSDRTTSIVTASNAQWSEIILRLSRNPRLMHELGARQFEELVAELLEREGLDVTLTSPQKDGGKDIMAYMNTPFGRFLYYIECKRYAPHKPVGVQIVRGLYGVVERDCVAAGVLVTTSRFTEPAIEFQQTVKNRMEFREFSFLCEWLQRHSEK